MTRLRRADRATPSPSPLATRDGESTTGRASRCASRTELWARPRTARAAPAAAGQAHRRSSSRLRSGPRDNPRRLAASTPQPRRPATPGAHRRASGSAAASHLHAADRNGLPRATHAPTGIATAPIDPRRGGCPLTEDRKTQRLGSDAERPVLVLPSGLGLDLPPGPARTYGGCYEH